MSRKIISPCLLASFLISLIFYAGCGDDSTSPAGGGFSFKLTVVDEDGAPISDLKLSRRCRIEYSAPASVMNQARMQMLTGAGAGPMASLQSGIRVVSIKKSAPGADPLTEFVLHPARPNPSTFYSYITLDIPLTCDVTIRIMDWRNREVVSYSINDAYGPGFVMIGYSFIDGGSNSVPNGIYSCEYIATEPVDSKILFKESVYFSGYTDRDPYRVLMGETNSRGSFLTTYKGYFPSLQGYQPQMGYNNDKVETGLFSFSDIIEIKVLSEPPPGTGGYIYWMTRELTVSDEANEFEWVFVPDDSIAVQ